MVSIAVFCGCGSLLAVIGGYTEPLAEFPVIPPLDCWDTHRETAACHAKTARWERVPCSLTAPTLAVSPEIDDTEMVGHGVTRGVFGEPI